MFLTELIAFMSVLATLIASVSSLIIALKTSSTVQQIHSKTSETQSTINGRLDDMVHSAELRGHTQGLLDGAAAVASITTAAQGHPPVSGADLQ